MFQSSHHESELFVAGRTSELMKEKPICVSQFGLNRVMKRHTSVNKIKSTTLPFPNYKTDQPPWSPNARRTFQPEFNKNRTYQKEE